MKKSIRSQLRDNLWVIVMDIIVVNVSFILALMLRYYVHSEFKSSALKFIDVYMRFAPFYTVLCLLVFYICGLYDGMWRYAGLRDMNRIIVASVVTAVINVAGTMIFFEPMPKSYYIVGGFLQFLMVAVVRFSYRFLLARRQQGEKQRAWTIPAMVVGSGELGREFIRYLEGNTPFQVMVIAGENAGKSMNGVPIVDRASIPMQIQYHGVQAVFIADENLSREQKDGIRQSVFGACVRDYLEYLSDQCLPSSALLRYINGSVTVVIDGVENRYANPNEYIGMLTDDYVVKCISDARIELEKNR